VEREIEWRERERLSGERERLSGKREKIEWRERESAPKRTALFWFITQKVVVISYRRFGTIYRSLLQG
jgi:hypothetical protein